MLMGKKLGIIFTGGDGPPPQLIKKLFEGVIADALLVAADSGLELAEDAGLMPDWVIGDMDSLGRPERLERYPAGSVIRHAADKDYTDTELALALLWENGCDAAWIAGGGGGRLDHLFGIRELFERGRFPSRWVTAHEDMHCIDGGVEAGRILKLHLTPGHIVSVFPLGPGPWKAYSTGLKWPLDNVRWERGGCGLSNIAKAGEIEICAGLGRFMVVLGDYGSNNS
jgi:thiamine pyrophosphokinase